MNYIYDILLNFNEQFFDFYDWNLTDWNLSDWNYTESKCTEEQLGNFLENGTM